MAEYKNMERLKKPEGTRRVFWHYNKPKSLQLKRDVWSVHFKDVCHIVDDIVVGIYSESKRNKTQPRVVMQGWAKELLISEENIAYII